MFAEWMREYMMVQSWVLPALFFVGAFVGVLLAEAWQRTGTPD